MYDPFLKSLNSIVNQFNISVGVTLVVSGGVIAGTLVSAKTFIDEFSTSFADAWPGGSNEDVRDGFAAWGQPGSEKVHEDFIHLKNAKYVYGKELMPNGHAGLLWRGSLDSVSGFSLGAFTQA